MIMYLINREGSGIDMPVGIFNSLTNAMKISRELKDKEIRRCVNYLVYQLDVGTIYNDPIALYSTEGDDIPW